MSELKITKERVLMAAEGCRDAKRILRTLFPEAFVTPGCLPFSNVASKKVIIEVHNESKTLYVKIDKDTILGQDPKDKTWEVRGSMNFTEVMHPENLELQEIMADNISKGDLIIVTASELEDANKVHLSHLEQIYVVTNVSRKKEFTAVAPMTEGGVRRTEMKPFVLGSYHFYRIYPTGEYQDLCNSWGGY